MERLNKVVMKQQRMSEFSKQKQEEASFINAARNEKAEKRHIKVEQVKKANKRQEIMAKKKVEQKDSLVGDRNLAIKEQVDRNNAYRKEAARLRAEELEDQRQEREWQKHQKQY